MLRLISTIKEAASDVFRSSPQKVLDNLSGDQRDMCNVYATAAQYAPDNVPTPEFIEDALRKSDFVHLRQHIGANDIDKFVRSLDDHTVEHLVFQGGVVPDFDQLQNNTHERGTIARRVNEAEGAELLKLNVYASAVRDYDKTILDVDEIAGFLQKDNELNQLFGSDDDLQAFAEEVHALVVDDYAMHKPEIAIEHLLRCFPELEYAAVEEEITHDVTPADEAETDNLGWRDEYELEKARKAEANAIIAELDDEQIGALKMLSEGYAYLGLPKDALLDGGKIGDIPDVQDIVDFGTNQSYATRPHDASLIADLDQSILYRIIELKHNELEQIRPSASEGESADLG